MIDISIKKAARNAERLGAQEMGRIYSAGFMIASIRLMENQYSHEILSTNRKGFQQ